jgi:hypothetical protein
MTRLPCPRHLLLMPGEMAPASTVHPPSAPEALAKPPGVAEPTSLDKRLEALSPDPDHSGKITDASQREAGERLIIDSADLTPEDLTQLKEAVKREKLEEQVIFHE